MAELPVRRQPRPPGHDGDAATLLSREWLVTNGLGGYASGTVAGVMTRRYHGLLVAALPNPLGRTVMLDHLGERLLRRGGEPAQLSGDERVGAPVDMPGTRWLSEFRLEAGMPVWRYEVGDAVIERRIVMPHRQNTVYVIWTQLEGPPGLALELRPALHPRGYEATVGGPPDEGLSLMIDSGHFTLSGGHRYPPLRLLFHGDASFTADRRHVAEIRYREEEARGFAQSGSFLTPGSFTLTLRPGEPVAFVASTEAPEVMSALGPEAALEAERERRSRLLWGAPASLHEGVAAEMVLAADQFVITPAGRTADAARALAVGDEIRTVIAGYHWFTDWGRDTMIALEGLTLTPGRHREAGSILRTFAHYVREGLIPNMFPDGSDEGLYHTADATLWFFHALDRHREVTGNRSLVRSLLPVLIDIVEHHRCGTRFGIGMDPADGLLRQGADGYQLTWMDAKVDGWVVTPRRGKAVEINALWYNALCLLARWLREARGERPATPYAELASQVRESFNRRFWFAEGGYCYDVVDGPTGDSTELRPNQIFAISLPNPVLERSRWEPVIEMVERHLLTPVGLRSLAPGSRDYKPRYYGDLRARDAAYHQGTVWAWLIGPWIDAYRKVYPERREEARAFLQGLAEHLDEFGVGSAAEIFDAEPPYTPRGCIAQAWSVAEMLRCWGALTE